jgi:hypothetical protein
MEIPEIKLRLSERQMREDYSKLKILEVEVKNKQ